MVALSDYLILGAILFCLSVAGIFLNRKNIIVLLMSIELMLLAEYELCRFLTLLGQQFWPGVCVFYPDCGRC